jgi:hypothetical protein
MMCTLLWISPLWGGYGLQIGVKYAPVGPVGALAGALAAGPAAAPGPANRFDTVDCHRDAPSGPALVESPARPGVFPRAVAAAAPPDSNRPSQRPMTGAPHDRLPRSSHVTADSDHPSGRSLSRRVRVIRHGGPGRQCNGAVPRAEHWTETGIADLCHWIFSSDVVRKFCRLHDNSCAYSAR